MVIFALLIVSQQGLQYGLPEGGSVKVQVWGEVKKPGIYYVTASTNILEALSYAGGPTSRSDLSHVKLVRSIAGTEVSYFNVNDYLSGKKEHPPILESGDLVFVNQSFSAKIRDFAAFMGVVGAVAYYFYRLAPD